MESLARLILLVFAAVLFVNLVRGTARTWLRSKFLGAA